MKIPVLFFACLMSLSTVFAQLKTTPVCPPFEVDVLAGNVNKFSPKSTLGEIKKAFPCFTDIVEETSGTKCAGVFIKDKGLSFYTDRNYIEVDESFKGKLTPALIGTDRGGLFKFLGYPKLKDISWDAFSTEYGTLVVYYNKDGKVIKLQISTKSTETLKLCE